MNKHIMFFVQTSTRPPNIHQKLTKHENFCKQKNKLPTKSHDDLEHNSNSLLNYLISLFHQRIVDGRCGVSR